MNGHTFQCHDEQSDHQRQYTKTLKALAGYAQRELTNADDFLCLFDKPMRNPEIEKPTTLPADGSELDKALCWSNDVKDYGRNLKAMKNSAIAIHSVICEQCNEKLQGKLIALDDFKTKNKERDCVWLLSQVRALMLQLSENIDGFSAMRTARLNFYGCKEAPDQTNQAYMENLKSWANTIAFYGGVLSENFSLIPTRDEKGTERTEETRRELALGRTLATAFINGADPHCHDTLITSYLANQHALGIPKFRVDLVAAHGLWKATVKMCPRNIADK